MKSKEEVQEELGRLQKGYLVGIDQFRGILKKIEGDPGKARSTVGYEAVVDGMIVSLGLVVRGRLHREEVKKGQKVGKRNNATVLEVQTLEGGFKNVIIPGDLSQFRMLTAEELTAFGEVGQAISLALETSGRRRRALNRKKR